MSKEGPWLTGVVVLHADDRLSFIAGVGPSTDPHHRQGCDRCGRGADRAGSAAYEDLPSVRERVGVTQRLPVAASHPLGEHAP